jgi:hemoglobin-like flavoprotein
MVNNMKKKQAQLIKQSWKRIEPMAQEAGEEFYRKLFNSEPLIRHMFKTDIAGQALKLTTTLAYVVENIDHLSSLRPQIRQLGQRHIDYGAQPEHYQVVCECMLKVLSDGMKEEWVPELAEAWSDLLHWISDNMQQTFE